MELTNQLQEWCDEKGSDNASIILSVAYVKRIIEALRGLGGTTQEPVAWRVDLADSQYFVDDADDAQAVDDCTNHNATMTPLYAGTVAVPREPTQAMLQAAANWRDRLEVSTKDKGWPSMFEQYRAFYKAMLAAAPAAPEAGSEEAIVMTGAPCFGCRTANACERNKTCAYASR